MTTSKAFQILASTGETVSKQMGSTVTTSLQALEHQIIQLGNGTSATVAKMDGQWVSLGTSTATNLGPSGAQGSVQNLEGTLTGLGTTAQTELGTTVPTAMSTASTTANTQFTAIVSYANMIIDVFKVIAISAKTYIQDGIKLAVDAAVASVALMSTNIATYAVSMTTTIASWIKASTTAMGAFASGPIKVVQGAFSTLSTSVATYMNSMSANINKFATAAATGFGKVATSTKTAHTALSSLSTSTATYMSSMSSRVSSFASSFSSAMSKVKSQADAAKKSVDALAKAVAALKSKSITIHVGLSGPGASFVRHGGSGLNIPSESGVSYAAGGKTWIQKTPKTLGNTHVAETFPEIISAIPLDPKEKMSPFHKLKMDLPIPAGIPSFSGGTGNGGGGGGGGGARQPIGTTYNYRNARW